MVFHKTEYVSINQYQKHTQGDVLSVQILPKFLRNAKKLNDLHTVIM